MNDGPFNQRVNWSRQLFDAPISPEMMDDLGRAGVT